MMSDYALISAAEVNAAHRRAIRKVQDEASARLATRRAAWEKRLEEERHYARRRALSESRALVEMVKAGVTISDQLMRPDFHGCDDCVWHLKNWRTGAEDGGQATMLRTNLLADYYGDPKDVILYALATR